MPLTAAFGRQKQIELYEVGQRGLQIELQASQTLKKEKKKAETKGEQGVGY